MKQQSLFDMRPPVTEEVPLKRSVRRIEKLGGDNGTLTLSDIPRLNKACEKILSLLRDRRWHTNKEISEVSGVLEHGRRLRELYEVFEIEKRKLANGVFEYRLIGRKS